MKTKNSEHSQPVKVTIHSNVAINKKKKKGLLEHTTTRHPQASTFLKKKAESARKLNDKQRLTDELENYESYAQAIAMEDGCEKKSTLDDVNGHAVGSQASVTSKLYLAYKIERQVQSIRFAIQDFERHNNDAGNLNRFYRAMLNGLLIAEDYHLMTIKQYEVMILRGSDASYNHKGASTTEQKESVKEMQQLMDDGAGQNEAARAVAQKIGRNPSTVKGWYRNNRK